MGDLIVGLSSFLFTVYVLFGLAAGISWPFWLILWLVKG